MGLTHSLLIIQLFPKKDLKALYNQHLWGRWCHCWGGAQKLLNVTEQRMVSLTAEKTAQHTIVTTMIWSGDKD